MVIHLNVEPAYLMMMMIAAERLDGRFPLEAWRMVANFAKLLGVLG